MDRSILIPVEDIYKTTSRITYALKHLNTVEISLQGSTAGQKNYLLIIPILGTLKYELLVQSSNQRLLSEVALFRQMNGMFVSNISELVKKLQVWTKI